MLNRINITLRLPNALYEACRRQAFDEKRSLNEIFIEAIRKQQNKRTAEEFKRQDWGWK